ncbi:MAG: hypothetical protein JW852_02115 [Spirochaetales bacterium]|nr:hypothetical protein [Spirochaetales bacterium]
MSKDTVEKQIRSAVGGDGQLTCEATHRVAASLGTKPLDIGKHANRFDIRITKCQLGLFGYAPQKGMPGYKLVKELDTLPEPVSTSVKEAAVQGKISCLKLWRIAEQHGVTRPDMGNIVETLKIKVRPCQLGCF